MESRIAFQLILYLYLALCTLKSHSLTFSKDTSQKLKVGITHGIGNDFQADISPFEKVLSNYYYIETKKRVDWFTAMQNCRRLGSDLIDFDNGNELDSIVRKLKFKSCYWLSLTNFVTRNKTFHSITTGRPPRYIRWGKVEPNNLGGNEHCGQLVSYSRRNFTMNDNKCDRKCSFICKSRLPVQVNFVVW